MANAPKAPKEKIDRRAVGAQIGKAVAPKDADSPPENELKHPDDERQAALAASAETDDLDEAPTRARAARPTRVDRSNAGGKRFYAGTQTVDHDLLKLDLAYYLKNISHQNEQPEFVKNEHVHWFHSVDSKGRKQESCSPSGNHTHLVTRIGESADGVPQFKVSGPVRFVKEKIKGVWHRTPKPVSEIEENDDHHTHELIYIRSEKIKLQETNSEFAKLESAMHARENPSIPGVLSG